MRFPRKRPSTSVMARVFIPDNSSTTGAGLTGLTSGSTNLTIEYMRELDSAVTSYSGANIEAQTTCGTYQAPSASTKIRFKETAISGVYELQFHDSATAFGAGDTSQNILINIREATTTALHIGPNACLIPLVPWDYQVAKQPVTLATADVSGDLPADLRSILGTALTETAGYIAAAFKKFFNVAVPVHTTASVDQGADINAKIGSKGGLPMLDAATGLVIQGFGDGGVTVGTVTNLTNAPASGLDAAGVRGALGMASANMDVQLSGIGTISGAAASAAASAAGNAALAAAIDVQAEMTAQGYTAARAGKLDHLDADVSGVSPTPQGNGSDRVTITWTNSVTGQPVAGGSVWVSSDAAGNTVVGGTLLTNASGQATFLLNPGSTYYLWGEANGVNDLAGVPFVAVAD